MRQLIPWLCLAAVLAGCATEEKHALDPKLGIADPSAVGALDMRKQKEHPVTAEMTQAADSLSAAKAPDFDLVDTNGAHHTLASLTQDKPLLIFFVEKNCPCCLGAKFYVDKMLDLYPNEVNAVGIINADGNTAKTWVKATKPKFTVLQDPKQKVIASYKAERGVYTTLIAPGGTIDKAYPGYSLESLQEMSKRIAQLTHVPAREYISTSAPKTMTSGCTFPELDSQGNQK